jgi:hypothetical protein
MITSHPKNSRRRCIKAISENTIIAMVVNGFMFPSLLFHKAVNIACLLPFVSCYFKEYITGADNRKTSPCMFRIEVRLPSDRLTGMNNTIP